MGKNPMIGISSLNIPPPPLPHQFPPLAGVVLPPPPIMPIFNQQPLLPIPIPSTPPNINRPIIQQPPHNTNNNTPNMNQFQHQKQFYSNSGGNSGGIVNKRPLPVTPTSSHQQKIQHAQNNQYVKLTTL